MKQTLRRIVIILAAAVFLFSGVMLLGNVLQLRAGEKQSQTVAELAVRYVSPEETFAPGEPVTEGDETELVEEGSQTPTEAPVEKPREYAPIVVDFDLLLEENSDIVAWIYSPGTPINYPIVRGADNEYYLRRLLDGSRNSMGTLFMDYRNASDLSHWNTLIFGHNMNNDAMFGSLTEYASQDYYEAHPVIYLLTAEKDYKIKVFAGFVTSANAELYNAFFPSAEERLSLLRDWQEASDFTSGTEVTADMHMVTLSTCSYAHSGARYVLIGVLEELAQRKLEKGSESCPYFFALGSE